MNKHESHFWEITAFTYNCTTCVILHHVDTCKPYVYYTGIQCGTSSYTYINWLVKHAVTTATIILYNVDG